MSILQPFFEVLWILILIAITFELFRILLKKTDLDSKINDDLLEGRSIKPLVKEYRYTKFFFTIGVMATFCSKGFEFLC